MVGTKERSIERAAQVAGILVAGGAVFCVFVAGYFFYYYSWTQERCFNSPAGPLLSYGVPLGLAGLLVTTLWFRPAYRLNLALVLVSTGMALFVVEFVFALTRSTNPTEERHQRRVNEARALGVSFDTRSRLEVIIDLRQKGVDAVPAIPPSTLLKRQINGALISELIINGAELFPLGGIADKVTVLCNENGEYLIYESDEHGFHNPPGSWAAGHVDIVALGDSFTQGFCVPSERNFVALIRRQWPATLNLGSSSGGPVTALAKLKEYARPLRPRVVLWFYFEGNDLYDMGLERDSPLLMRYMEGEFSQGLLTRQAEIDRALGAYVESAMAKSAKRLEDQLVGITRKPKDIRWLGTLPLQAIKLGSIRSRLGLVSGDLCSPGVDPRTASATELDLFRSVLLRAQEAVQAWGGTLYFVFLPEWPRYASPQQANPNREQVLAVARSLGLPVIDIHPVFQAHPDPLTLFPFRQDGHYAEAGHRVVAEAVLRALPINRGELWQKNDT